MNDSTLFVQPPYGFHSLKEQGDTAITLQSEKDTTSGSNHEKLFSPLSNDSDSYVLIPKRSVDENMEHYLPFARETKEFIEKTATAKGNGTQAVVVPNIDGTDLGNSIQGQYWFFPLLLLAFVIYSCIVSTHYKEIIRRFKAVFFGTRQGSIYDLASEKAVFLISLNLLSLCTLPIFTYFARHILGIQMHSAYHTLLLQFAAVFAVFFLFKSLVSRFLCYVFFDQNIFSKVRSAQTLLLSLTSISIFVVDLLLAYSSIPRYALNAGMVIIVVALLFYLYKFVSLFFNGFGSLFYMFLYLCTLEILPLAILIVAQLSIV